MPELDDRIERALRESARSPDADPGVVARGVERKKVRRQARRNAATGALVAAVLVTTAVVTVAIVRRDDGEDRRVSTPPSTTAAQPADPVAAQEEIAAVLPGPEISPPEYLSDTEAVVDMASARGVRVEYVGGSWQIDPASVCRIDASSPCGPPDVRVSDGSVALGPDAYEGAAAPLEPLPQRDEEYVRGPVVAVGDSSWVAVYEREGSTWKFPPSHLLDLSSGRRVDLQGEILSFAAGEDETLWAVTHDEIVDTDGTEFRVKRIDADGSVHSEPIPIYERPVGRIATGAGASWVPVADGVLRFDLSTGRYEDKIVLSPATALRAVAIINGNAYATNGSLIERIDGTDHLPVIDTAAAGILSDLTTAGDAVWALAVSGEVFRFDQQMTTIEIRVPLPVGFTPSSLAAAGDAVVITGTADLAGASASPVQSVAVEPVVLVADSSGLSSTVAIAGGSDTASALEASGDLLFTSNGRLYRAQLP